MNDCEYFEEQIDLLLDGMLTPSEEAALRAHLEHCPACAQRERELRELRDMTAGLDTEAPPELHARIMAAVAAERGPETPRKTPWIKKLLRRQVLAPVAACAVLAIVVVLVKTAPMTGSSGTGSADSCTTESTEAPAADSGTGASLYATAPATGSAKSNTETANDALMTYAAVTAWRGDLDALRAELNTDGAVMTQEAEDGALLAAFEQGSAEDTAFAARLGTLGFTAAEVPEAETQPLDEHSVYVLYVLLAK